MSSVRDISTGKKEKRVQLKFEHYDFVYFPFKEEWQKPDSKLELGQRVIVERDEALREKRVPTRKRRGDDLVRFRMFRVTPRSLGISPEDYNMTTDEGFQLNKEFGVCFDSNSSDAALGMNWRAEYNPELNIVDSMSLQLKEMINISHLFVKRPTYKKRPYTE